MNRFTLPLALLGAALVAVPAALAQDMPARGMAGALGMDPAALEARMFEMLDTDGDGVVSAEEWAARREVMRGAGPLLRAEAIIERFDADGDGGLNAEELAAALTEMRGEMAQRARGAGKRGQDGAAMRGWRNPGPRAGGEVPASHIAEMFDRIDTDGDGTISPEEFKAGFRAMAGQQHGRGALPLRRDGMREAPAQRGQGAGPQHRRMHPQRGQ